MITANLVSHVKNNVKIYVFLCAAFIVGLSAGTFTINGLSKIQIDELNSYFQSFLQLIGNQKINTSELLKISLFDNIKFVTVLWFLGVTIIGIPFIFIVISIRGFVTGFTLGFMLKTLGLKGILFNSLILLPKELICVPCIIILGVNGIKFSLDIIKNRSNKQISKNTLKNKFIEYCTVTLFFLLIIFISSLIETYITPFFTRSLAPYLRQY